MKRADPVWWLSYPGELPGAAWGSLPCLACSQALGVGYLRVGIPGVTPCFSPAWVVLPVPPLPGS